MNVASLVGAVAAAYLREELQTDTGAAQSTARYVLNLSAEQVAAVARAVLADPYLKERIDIKLPISLVSDQGLPDETLTTENATFYRNADCPKAAYLLAEHEHGEDASIREIAKLGPPELLERIDLWVREASTGLPIAQEQQRWWEKALTGLRDLRIVSIDRFAVYILRTRRENEDTGRPIIDALGAAMPALRLPNDPACFGSLKERQRGHASAWRQQFNNAHKRRSGLLLKQTSSQLLLSEEDLRNAFEKVAHQIPNVCHPTIEAFIRAPSGWNAQAEALAEQDWEQIKPIFDGLQRDKFNLGKNTLEYFSELEEDKLEDEEREYLKLLSKRSEKIDEDTDFYEAHRSEIKDDKKLKSAWDRFVYGRPIETTDFIAGICAVMEPLYNRMPPGNQRKLKIKCESATKRDLRSLNYEAGLYFAHRYAGLRRLFSGKIDWDVGDLFEFDQLVSDWKKGDRAKNKLNTSTAKPALQLKFVVELETTTDEDSIQKHSTQLIWRYNPSCVASQLVDDWGRLTQNPFPACRTQREFTADKSIDLANVKTFMPAFDRDRGSFVPAAKPDRNLDVFWRKNLRECVDQAYLSAQDAKTLGEAFATFESAYKLAVVDFPKKGGGADSILNQTTAYAALLETVLTLAKGDRNRNKLLKPLLMIGVAPIDGGRPAAVVAPWHPMRLAAIWRKYQLAIDLVSQVLASIEAEGDPKLFFRDIAQDFEHVLYPEIVAIWTNDGPQFLTASDVVADYSLHEPPIADPRSENDTNESPAEGSSCVHDLVKRYIALQPHERSNMSVVLFNCDSARLPQAVVAKIGDIQDDEDDVRCQVLLRHIESQKLRNIYCSILSSEATADAYSASEASQDFMARLRISVIADQAPPPNPKDGHPYDIVFSQDVISRHAQLEWYLEQGEPADIRKLLPSRWSRRRAAARDDLKSAVFLCCPVQSAEGWAYISAVASIFKGDRDESTSKRLLPVRQLDFADGRTKRIFEETHDLGNWVVNFDELLDRRQLMNHQVRVIRYKQISTQGRNLIISSRAPMTLLRSMIMSRLRALQLPLTDSEIRTLADRLIDEANDVSGDIVLRAATCGQSASELMGIVLSRRMLRDDLGTDQLIGWYFLDDYASWLGQREQQIADLLAICPQVAEDGTLMITLAVSEAKYVEIESLAAKRKESQKQLRDTLERLEDAIFGDPERLDRQSWLARLADLMLDGIRIPAARGIDLGEWRRAMREGRCKVHLKGLSHVFVPTSSDADDPTIATEIADVRYAYQEIIGRKALKQLLMAYWHDQSTADVRREMDFFHMDFEPIWRTPGSGIAPLRNAYRMPVQRPTSLPTLPVLEPLLDAPAEMPNEPSIEDLAPQPVSGESVPLPVDSSRAQTQAHWAYSKIGDLIASALHSAPIAPEEDGWLQQTAFSTRSALQQLQLQAKLVGSALTPNSALLKFAGNANLTVEQVLKKRSELLTTYGLNVISVRPEPGAVTISVERPKRQTIDIRSLWADWSPTSSGWGNQELLIAAQENSGAPLFLSPGKDHAPHTLIAGSTGSGKSVLMQNIILGIAATNTPEQARIVLIDPKQGVDYFAFDRLPHIDGGIVDDQIMATQRLEELVAEMDLRYARFKEKRVSNLAAYNAEAPLRERLPVIWLIHDEFAEWMLTEEYKGAVSAIVQRLGVKARAAGIYLIFAAQRPDAYVMPMQLRSNLGNRLILRVDSEGTSEIALGEKGAERLLGRGHLLAKLEGNREMIYAQVPFVEIGFVDTLIGKMLHARS
ncbi:FtsK/SpoIIIE domain-containing protein [uncultured Propionivibrio sp.]|uniref:FtsK/SpoIIIE domain-containing protein n=1 Tax=uncultured Propionivibrio sp. TaxID=426737 RepID=UPI0029C04BFA|nr:FtsK/SpoIIIE domain-containing protein [uncultured Propionivibrio sp.]